MNEPSDLNDFETLANVINVLPDHFAESELHIMRGAYSEFVNHFAAKCNIGNPDEIRAEAARIGDIGDSLQVDTADVQETLRESADEVEKEEGAEPDDEGYGRHGGDSDNCSDAELDSMFGTLGSC